MGDTKVYEKIFSIHDQTIGTLRSLKLLPFPENYKKYFDEIFNLQADSSLIKAQEKDISTKSTHEDLSRYLDIAHKSIASFIETHNDISHVAEMQERYINKVAEDGIVRCANFVDGLSELGKNMSLELKKAQQKIDDLTTQLEETVLQLTTDPLTRVTNRKGLIDDLNSAIEAGVNKSLPIKFAQKSNKPILYTQEKQLK